jgi:uncharacterized protein (DUF305 family)
LPDHDTN